MVKSGAVVGLIRTKDDWLGHDGERVCADERTLKFHKAGANRIIDVDMTLKATNGPAVFGDTKEGMFGLRLASSMDVKRREGGQITNAEGVTDVAARGKTSLRADYTGPVEGKTVGIAVLNHPTASDTSPPGTSAITASSPPTPLAGVISGLASLAGTPCPGGVDRLPLSGDPAPWGHRDDQRPAALAAYASPLESRFRPTDPSGRSDAPEKSSGPPVADHSATGGPRA